MCWCIFLLQEKNDGGFLKEYFLKNLNCRYVMKSLIFKYFVSSKPNTERGPCRPLAMVCCSVTRSCPTPCDPRTAASQASLSFTISWSLLRLKSIESLMPSNYLILWCPLLLLPSVFASIMVFSSESVLRIRWPKYWSFCISPFNEYSGLISFQFSSVAQSCPTLCDPMNYSTPGLPVHHQLPEFTQAHVHQVGDAIQPSHPLLSPSPPALNPSQHQSLSQWVSSSHEVAKVLEFQL